MSSAICFNLDQSKILSSGNGLSPVSLTLFLVLTCLQYKSFENPVGKGESARDKQFLLFPQCFLPFLKTFSPFHQTRNCRLQTLSIWKSLKFVVWERVKCCQFKEVPKRAK